MAAENEIQFFEAPFQYQIGEFTSNVNLTYHKLINTRPVKMPQMNTGFETPFTQAYNEKGDKAYFGIKKREGFQKCEELESIIEYNLGTKDYIITDHQIVEGERFLMICDIGYNNMIILKSKVGRYLDCQPTPTDVCYGDYVPVTNNQSGMPRFNTTPCSYHKFQKIPTLQSDEKKIIEKMYIGTFVSNGGATTAVLFNKDRVLEPGLQVGKFTQIYNSNNTDIVLGQALQVGNFDSIYGWFNMGYGSWIGITDENQEKVYDNDGNEVGVLNYQGPVDITIFDGAKPGIAFTGEWQRHKTKDNGIFQYTGFGFQFVKQTDLNNTYITSVTDDSGGLVYTTNKGYVYFMRPHTNTGQSLGGTIYSSNYMYHGWDLAKGCGDYVFLFGPDSTGIAYKNGTDERGDYRWNVQMLDRNLGYFNKDSVLVYNEELYMIDNKKRFVKLDLEATTDSYYRVHFKLKTTDMSLHWINTDLRNISRDLTQHVSLNKDDFRIYIIINDSIDSIDNNGTEVVKNTKILVYEDELKYWHRWYLCGLDIRYFSEGEWLGRGLYINKGTYDCQAYDKQDNKLIPVIIPIKQIISMSFGDTSWFTWKEVLWIKAAIGYHSKISEDTIFKFRADGGGYSVTVKMGNLQKSVSYIKTINELRNSGKTNLDNVQVLQHAMPIGIGVYSGNGVGLIKDIYRTDATEFGQFCNYEPTMTYKIDTCCDPKPASEPDGNGCTMKAPDADKENFGSDRFQYHYNVAKYSTIKFNIGQQGQNFFFELIANNYDEIEFCGFMVGRMFMDNNFDTIANMPYYLTTPKDSLPGMMGK